MVACPLVLALLATPACYKFSDGATFLCSSCVEQPYCGTCWWPAFLYCADHVQLCTVKRSATPVAYGGREKIATVRSCFYKLPCVVPPTCYFATGCDVGTGAFGFSVDTAVSDDEPGAPCPLLPNDA
jgi:hypothetical protein